MRTTFSIFATAVALKQVTVIPTGEIGHPEVPKSFLEKDAADQQTVQDADNQSETVQRQGLYASEAAQAEKVKLQKLATGGTGNTMVDQAVQFVKAAVTSSELRTAKMLKRAGDAVLLAHNKFKDQTKNAISTETDFRQKTDQSLMNDLALERKERAEGLQQKAAELAEQKAEIGREKKLQKSMWLAEKNRHMADKKRAEVQKAAWEDKLQKMKNDATASDQDRMNLHKEIREADQVIGIMDENIKRGEAAHKDSLARLDREEEQIRKAHNAIAKDHSLIIKQANRLAGTNAQLQAEEQEVKTQKMHLEEEISAASKDQLVKLNEQKEALAAQHLAFEENEHYQQQLEAEHANERKKDEQKRIFQQDQLRAAIESGNKAAANDARRNIQALNAEVERRRALETEAKRQQRAIEAEKAKLAEQKREITKAETKILQEEKLLQDTRKDAYEERKRAQQSEEKLQTAANKAEQEIVANKEEAESQKRRSEYAQSVMEKKIEAAKEKEEALARQIASSEGRSKTLLSEQRDRLLHVREELEKEAGAIKDMRDQRDLDLKEHASTQKEIEELEKKEAALNKKIAAASAEEQKAMAAQRAAIQDSRRVAEAKAAELKQGIEEQSAALAAKEKALIEGTHDVALRLEEETRKARTLSVKQQRDEAAMEDMLKIEEQLKNKILAEKEKMKKLEAEIAASGSAATAEQEQLKAQMKENQAAAEKSLQAAKGIIHDLAKTTDRVLTGEQAQRRAGELALKHGITLREKQFDKKNAAAMSAALMAEEAIKKTDEALKKTNDRLAAQKEKLAEDEAEIAKKQKELEEFKRQQSASASLSAHEQEQLTANIKRTEREIEEQTAALAVAQNKMAEEDRRVRETAAEARATKSQLDASKKSWEATKREVDRHQDNLLAAQLELSQERTAQQNLESELAGIIADKTAIEAELKNLESTSSNASATEAQQAKDLKARLAKISADEMAKNRELTRQHNEVQELELKALETKSAMEDAALKLRNNEAKVQDLVNAGRQSIQALHFVEHQQAVEKSAIENVQAKLGAQDKILKAGHTELVYVANAMTQQTSAQMKELQKTRAEVAALQASQVAAGGNTVTMAKSIQKALEAANGSTIKTINDQVKNVGKVASEVHTHAALLAGLRKSMEAYQTSASVKLNALKNFTEKNVQLEDAAVKEAVAQLKAHRDFQKQWNADQTLINVNMNKRLSDIESKSNAVKKQVESTHDQIVSETTEKLNLEQKEIMALRDYLRNKISEITGAIDARPILKSAQKDENQRMQLLYLGANGVSYVEIGAKNSTTAADSQSDSVAVKNSKSVVDTAVRKDEKVAVVDETATAVDGKVALVDAATDDDSTGTNSTASKATDVVDSDRNSIDAPANSNDVDSKSVDAKAADAELNLNTSTDLADFKFSDLDSNSSAIGDLNFNSSLGDFNSSLDFNSSFGDQNLTDSGVKFTVNSSSNVDLNAQLDKQLAEWNVSLADSNSSSFGDLNITDDKFNFTADTEKLAKDLGLNLASTPDDKSFTLDDDNKILAQNKTPDDQSLNDKSAVTEKKDAAADKVEKKDDTVEKTEKKEDTIDMAEKKGDTVEKIEKKDDTIDKAEKKDDTVEKIDKKDDTIDKAEKKEGAFDKIEKKGDTVEKVEKKAEPHEKAVEAAIDANPVVSSFLSLSETAFENFKRGVEAHKSSEELLDETITQIDNESPYGEQDGILSQIVKKIKGNGGSSFSELAKQTKSSSDGGPAQSKSKVDDKTAVSVTELPTTEDVSSVAPERKRLLRAES